MVTLRWYLNPPTPAIYLNVAGPLIDELAVDDTASTTVQDISRYLIELSVCDAFFRDKAPSSIAYAAIMVAIAEVQPTSNKAFLHYQLEQSELATTLCIERIHQLYNLAQMQMEEGDETPFDNRGASPTTVI